MLDNLLNVIKEEKLSRQLCKSFLGIEVEEHRVDHNGKLSREPHPQKLGSRTHHPYLQSDFSESQSEIITAPFDSVGKVIQQLDTLQTILTRSLQNDDRIWPLSMPPALDSLDKQFIAEHFDRPAYKEYRQYLIKKYGVPQKIITGVHVNYSIPNSFFECLYKHYENNFENFNSFKNALYFRIVQNFVLNRWLLTYLFGASPVAERGFFTHSSDPKFEHPVRSIRNSRFGYVNNRADQVNVTLYSSLENFIDGLESAVKTGLLYGPAEFYGPVRLRGQDRLSDYYTKGISYLEFRVFDNNPFSTNGVDRNALIFLKIFLIYLLVTPVDEKNIKDKLKQAFDENNAVALEQPDKTTFKFEAGKAVLEKMLELVKFLGLESEETSRILQNFNNVLTHPKLTPAGRLMPVIKNGSLQEFGNKVSSKNKQLLTESNELLPAMSHFSDKTQLLIFKAVELGINYTIEKRGNNRIILKLTYANITKMVDVENLRSINAQEYLCKLFPTLKIE